MDTPSTRRRPVVTYGRQARRTPRVLNLELDEIFSPAASPNISPCLPSGHLNKPMLSSKSTNPAKSAYNKPVVISRKPNSPNESESGSSTREEDQVTAQLDRETKLHPTNKKELDLFDVPSSDDETAPPPPPPPPPTRTSTGNIKSQSTVTATVNRELDLFDVPYSDDEAATPPTKTIVKLPAPTAHTLKRKRVANKSTKNEKIIKAVLDRNEIPLELPPIGSLDAIMPKAKRTKTKEDTGKKITEGERISKPATKENGKGNNATEKNASKLKAKLQRGMNAIEPSAGSAPPPERSRVTRSVSRALSEEPPAMIPNVPVERLQAITKKRELEGNTVKKTAKATNDISGASSTQPIPKQSPRKTKIQKPPSTTTNSPPPKKPASLGVITEESPAPQKQAHGRIVLNSKPFQPKTNKEVSSKQLPTKAVSAAPDKPVQSKTIPPKVPGKSTQLKPIAVAKTGEVKQAPVRQTTKTTTTITTTTTKKVVSKIRTVSKPEVFENEKEKEKDTTMEEAAPSYSQQLGLFAYDESSPEPAPRPRKRLIDALVGGQDGPRKRSRSPSFSDGDSESLEDGAVSLNRETSLNEATILSLQRSTTGGRGPRITYARERSYRMNDATSLEDMLNIPMDTPLTSNEPARKNIEEHIQPMEIEEEKPRTQIKNIHELRAAGEHNRFVDDVEDLFLDIEGGTTIGQKRNGYFELANRLKDKTFSHKFRTNCFDERVLTKLDTQTDPIITFSLSYLTLLFLDLDSTPRTMIHLLTHSITTMLLRMLSSSKDISSIARDRSLNMSKISQATLGDFRGHILHFLPEAKARTLSPQILALKTIDNLIRAFRSRGGEEEVLPKSILRGLVEILAPFAEKKEFPKELTLNGIALLELPISILEAYASGGYGSLETKISSEEMAVLSKLFVAITKWQPTTDVDLKPIKLLLLRVLINITNQHSATCDAITDASLIICLTSIIKEQFHLLLGKLEEQQRLFSVDYLILTLGLMMNLADFSEKARTVIGEAMMPVALDAALDSEAPTAPTNTHALDLLLHLFLSHHTRTTDASSLEESHTNVAFGYLTVLLGTLCQDDHIRYQMRAKLPNGGIKLLLAAVEEFIKHHRKVDREIMREEIGAEEIQEIEMEEMEGVNEFTQRLGEVVVRLRAYV